MKKSEFISMLLLLALVVYLRIIMSQNSSLIELYSGPSFRNSDIYVFVYYVLFAIYTFILFGKTSKYVSKYGIVILIQSKSIKRVLRNVVFTTVIFIVISEGLKILLYILFAFIKYKTVHFESFERLIFMITMSVLVLTFLLMIQMLLEFFVDSRVALIITHALYIVLFVIGNIMYQGRFLPLLNKFNPINYMYSNRLFQVYPHVMQQFYIPVIAFLILVFVLVALAIPFTKRKDWI